MGIATEFAPVRPHGERYPHPSRPTGALAWPGLAGPSHRIDRRRFPCTAALEAWLEKVSGEFNVLPMTGDAFRLWAKLMVGRRDDVYEDAMIAATALVSRLTVATRNVRDFDSFGVDVVNPFSTI